MLAEMGKEWFLFQYLPVTLFSLRSTLSTNKGGKTLLVPTPYSFKLALVDATFRWGDESLAREVFEAIKFSRTSIRPPRWAVVNQTFVKIKQEKRGSPAGVYDSTIAYREYCFMCGQLTIGLEVEGESSGLVENSARYVNYLGKRGGFFQYVGCDKVHELPDGFSIPFGAVGSDGTFPAKAGILQVLDDIGQASGGLFDLISSYSDRRVSLHKHRVLLETSVPYRFVQSSRSYTLFERISF